MTATAIRLLLVDDDPLVRAGPALTTGGADDIEIVGEAGDGDDAAPPPERTRRDVVLMDVRMPSVGGPTATRRLRERENAPQVVVLTTFHADDQVLRALPAGAAGFVLKDTPPAETVQAVRRVAAGEPVLSPAVTRRLMRYAAGATGAGARRARARERLAALNGRESEVAVGRGLANAQIAAELFMWPASRPTSPASWPNPASTTASRWPCWRTTRDSWRRAGTAGTERPPRPLFRTTGGLREGPGGVRRGNAWSE